MKSQMVSAWPNHVKEVLGISWLKMPFLTSITMPVMIPLICLFFVPFYPGAFVASLAPSSGSRRFPSTPFVCLSPPSSF